MKKVRITAIRKACYPDLMEKYENPIEHACDVEEGMSWVSVDGEKPEGFCGSAWESMAYFVRELARGGGNFYDGWMKDPHSAMISCNDGFRPVSFYIEVIECAENMEKHRSDLQVGQKLWAINKNTGREEALEIVGLFSEFFVVSYHGKRCRYSYENINTKFFTTVQQKTEKSCDQCFLRSSGACSSLAGEVCEDYRAKQNIPKEEIDAWPRYGDAMAYRMRDHNHFK